METSDSDTSIKDENKYSKGTGLSKLTDRGIEGAEMVVAAGYEDGGREAGAELELNAVGI
ncbi:hypothetical protein Ciccas_002738 [Cichlidogyrus casuarinus]|uniref:Uncharacterized protein n=1 Tax=Cichlidogyrus casuarinus TaxID=1844966 RepID=A0ABD2QHC2_9PLAT